MDKIVPASANLSKLSDEGRNNVVKKDDVMLR